MPFYLEEADVSADVAGLQSVLIVPCRFCPAASLAVQSRKPYIELFRRLFKTGSYETYIRGLERRLQDLGIRTALFDSKLPHQFVACMWTAGRRRALARKASEFDAVLVLGCDAAAETVRIAVGRPDYPVILGMEAKGIMNVLPTVSFPLNISLEMKGLATVGTIGSPDRKNQGPTSTQNQPRSCPEAKPVASSSG